MRFAASILSILMLIACGAAHCQAPPAGDETRISGYEKAIAGLQQQIDELRSQIAAMRAAQTAQPEKARPAAPAATSTRSTTIEPMGFLQTQYESTTGGHTDRLFIRRARLGVRGQLSPLVRFLLNGDLTSASALLRDGVIDLRSSVRPSAWTLRAGQFKVPYSLDELTPDELSPYVERAIVTQNLADNHDRDTGIEFISPGATGAGISGMLSLQNGAGRSQFVPTAHKLVAGRVVLGSAPGSLLGGRVAAGFSARLGDVENLNLAAGKDREGNRYGADLSYAGRRVNAIGEYLWGRGNGLRPSGYYLLLTDALTRRTSLVLRYEGFSPDPALAALNRTTIGLLHEIGPLTSVRLNYEFLSGSAPAGLSSGIRLRLQTIFP